MARKDFDEYYNKIASQLFELDRVFKDLSAEADSGMVEPERLEQVKVTIEPIKTSYQTLSYIKYLLDKPTRKSKRSRYDGQNKRVLDSTKGYQSKDYIDRNSQILRGLKGK
jgi:hypothetical protein